MIFGDEIAKTIKKHDLSVYNLYSVWRCGHHKSIKCTPQVVANSLLIFKRLQID